MQRAQQQPVGLKYGYLSKSSQKLKRWDDTWFVLGTQELTYYNRGAALKKTIDLQQAVSLVAADVGDAKRAHSFKLTTASFPRPLILAAETSEQADEWIAAIRAVATLYAPPPESPNGTPKLTPDNRNMLDCTMRIVQSAGKLVCAAAQSGVPGVYSKLILDGLSMSALMCGTTGRVVVYKPKVQSGGQRFTQSVTETMALAVKYKHTYQAARKKIESRGKAEDPLASVNSELESLIEVIKRTVLNWMPNTLDPELTKALDAEEPAQEGELDEEEDTKNEKGEITSSPYVTPFFIPQSSTPPPCRKHWDVLVDECVSLISYMESLNKGAGSPLRRPSAATLSHATSFVQLSRRMRETPNIPYIPEEEITTGLSDEQFSLMKQQILGSASTIDYFTTSVGLTTNDTVPSQIVDIISHAQGISSALAKLPRAIKKHRTKTLVSAVENLGSFSYSIARLVSQMLEQENFLCDQRARSSFREEVHAVQYIAIHLLTACTSLVEHDFRAADILPFTDTAKLLALGVANTLESVRNQLAPAHATQAHATHAHAEKRKLASELTDAHTGSMVFWFGMVGHKASVHC
jgi:hypothetical protein